MCSPSPILFNCFKNLFRPLVRDGFVEFWTLYLKWPFEYIVRRIVALCPLNSLCAFQLFNCRFTLAIYPFTTPLSLFLFPVLPESCVLFILSKTSELCFTLVCLSLSIWLDCLVWFGIEENRFLTLSLLLSSCSLLILANLSRSLFFLSSSNLLFLSFSFFILANLSRSFFF